MIKMPERNIDMRIEARRAKVYYLFMMGKTLREISETLQIGETTIDRDLEAIRKEISFDEKTVHEPINWDKVRQDALDSLKMIKVMLLNALQESNGKPWTQARILSIMKDIDIRILERVAQPPATKVDIKMWREDALTIVGFIKDKHPEFLSEFRAYLKMAKQQGKKEINVPTETSTGSTEERA